MWCSASERIGVAPNAATIRTARKNFRICDPYRLVTLGGALVRRGPTSRTPACPMTYRHGTPKTPTQRRRRGDRRALFARRSEPSSCARSGGRASERAIGSRSACAKLSPKSAQAAHESGSLAAPPSRARLLLDRQRCIIDDEARLARTVLDAAEADRDRLALERRQVEDLLDVGRRAVQVRVRRDGRGREAGGRDRHGEGVGR